MAAPQYGKWKIDGVEYLYIGYATDSTAGLMSPTDKAKLDALTLQAVYNASPVPVAINMPVTDSGFSINDNATPSANNNLFDVNPAAAQGSFFLVDAYGQVGQNSTYNLGSSLNGDISAGPSPPPWMNVGTITGYTLYNVSPADAVNTVQNSPVLAFAGRAWRTGVNVNRSTGARIVMQSVSGANTTQNLVFMMRAQNQGSFASYNQEFTFGGSGVLTLSTTGSISSASLTTLTLTGNVADGATATGIQINNTATLNTSGSKILGLANNGTNIFGFGQSNASTYGRMWMENLGATAASLSAYQAGATFDGSSGTWFVMFPGANSTNGSFGFYPSGADLINGVSVTVENAGGVHSMYCGPTGGWDFGKSTNRWNNIYGTVANINNGTGLAGLFGNNSSFGFGDVAQFSFSGANSTVSVGGSSSTCMQFGYFGGALIFNAANNATIAYQWMQNGVVRAQVDASGNWSPGADITYALGNITGPLRWLNVSTPLVQAGASTLRLTSGIADGANATAVIGNSTVTLANASSRLLSLQNNSTEKFLIAFSGAAVTVNNSTGGGFYSFTGAYDSTFATGAGILNRTDLSEVQLFPNGAAGATTYYRFSTTAFYSGVNHPDLGTSGGYFGQLFVTNATLSSGIFSKYNNETTAGVGVAYIEKVGQDVASSGAGAQNTTIATFTPGTSGLYRVAIVFSTVTADTVTIQVTFTDAVNTTAITLTPINAVAPGANNTASATVLIRANTSTAIVAKITNSAQAGTKASATVERLN